METERTVINASLELRIKDFCTATEKLDVHQMHHDEQYDIVFEASVYPNGVNEDTEGWVVVVSGLKGDQRGTYEKSSHLQWTVSIIDFEGNFRFPRSLDKSSVADDFTDAKYLEKSFILCREDELLSEGALLLRCDISFDFKIKKSIRMWNVGGGSNRDDYVSHIFGYKPPAVCSNSGKETGCESGFYKAFEFTPQVVRPPKSQDSGESSNVYLIHDMFPLSRSESKENSAESKADNWIFDTSPDRFILSLQDNLGSRLVKSSSVIRRCINAPMKEKLEKRVELSKVESETFRSVLFFLQSGNLLHDKFDETAEVYKFSHMYEMENLQQKSAEHMVEMIKTETDLEETEKIANLYSDEYLLALLESLQHEYGNLHTHIVNDKPLSDSYI